MKHLGDNSFSFFSQILPETHVLSIYDHVLNDPFPEVVREEHPINFSLPVPIPKRIGLWFPDEDEIALFGRQHHLIPIDHKHVAMPITDQIGWMQISVADNEWECSRL